MSVRSVRLARGSIRRYSEEEDVAIKKRYPIEGAVLLAREFQRTRSSVKARAQYLGLMIENRFDRPLDLEEVEKQRHPVLPPEQERRAARGRQLAEDLTAGPATIRMLLDMLWTRQAVEALLGESPEWFIQESGVIYLTTKGFQDLQIQPEQPSARQNFWTDRLILSSCGEMP